MISMRYSAFVLIGFLAISPATSCSEKTEDVAVTTVEQNNNGQPLPKKGIVIRDEEKSSLDQQLDVKELSVEKLAMQIKQERFIIAKPGETVRLYTDWSGISSDELKLINDDKLPTFGQKYVLSLTASEFSDFERKRQEYWNERKKEMYDQYDIKPAEYVVKKNDTLDGISRKFDVPLWFLVMHNEAIDPYRLSPGTKLIAPKLAEKAEENMAQEGGGEQITEEDFKEVYPVIVKKGETVGAYAKWGQISIDDIKRANRHLKSLNRIRIGDTINLPLTAKQFRRFQELRKIK